MDNVNEMARKGKHFTWEERLILQRLYRKEKITSPAKLASILGKSKRTIQRELKRGLVSLTATDLSTYETYSPDIAQKKADENLQAKGPDLKLGCDYALAEAVSRLIKENNYSPDAVVMRYEKEGWPTDTRISTRTLYRYIADGLIPGVTQENLLHKGKRSKKSSKGPKRHSRAACAGRSITTRPEEADSRSEQGHWEMDCVVSGKDKGNEALLTLTERQSRRQIIRKIGAQSSAAVVAEMDRIERSFGSKGFREIFKSITCDNGSEFMDAVGIEGSCLTQKIRTRVYYAHPYCASERGSNENANGIIRRFIPKGAAVRDFTKKKIREIQDWMNSYPRKILGGLSAQEVFFIQPWLYEKQ